MNCAEKSFTKINRNLKNALNKKRFKCPKCPSDAEGLAYENYFEHVGRQHSKQQEQMRSIEELEKEN